MFVLRSTLCNQEFVPLEIPLMLYLVFIEGKKWNSAWLEMRKG